MRINLRKMHDNQAGTIASVKVAGELGRRLRDMGLVPGTEIKIQGRAPLADYIEVEIE
jgi:ferrous iron transport protein A